MNNKCPYCGNEMEKGLLQTGGNNMIWDVKEHSLLVLPSKEGVKLAYRPMGCAVVENVYCCKNCKRIMLQYEE